ELDVKATQLRQTQADLRHQRAQVVISRQELERGQRILARRLNELYRSDPPDVVTIILSAKGFADLLEREEFLGRIARQDRQIITRVRDARTRALQATARLGRLERQQRAVTSTIQQRRDELVRLKGNLVDIRSGLKGTRSDKAHALA